MTKKLKDTTDDEILLSYVDQLKKEIRGLEKSLKEKSKPHFDFTSVTKLLRDISNHWIIKTAFGISIGLLVIFGIYQLILFAGPNGEYYVERAGYYTITTTPECTCPPVKTTQHTCYKVKESINLGHDRYITECYDKDEVFKVAEDFADKWKQLNSRNK
jgi:hypothetical protein